MNRIFILGLLFVAAISCKPKKLVTSSDQIAPKSLVELQSAIDNNLTPIEWLDGRASVSIKVEGSIKKFKSQIRVKTDSLFMANGKELSIEGGRILISRDSFYLINRLAKTFEIKSFEAVTAAYGVPLTFDALMSVLVGNPIEPIDTENYEVVIRDRRHNVEGYNRNLKIEYVILDRPVVLQSSSIKDIGTQKSCSVLYEDWQEIDGRLFPLLRTFTFDNGQRQTMTMIVDFSKIELNAPRTFRFDIPPHFTQVF